jgi:hypothetical protein
MDIYVAGAYCDKPAVQQVQARLVDELQCKITHDWTTANNATAVEDALMDEHGVQRADAVVLVFSVAQHAYRGTFTEMGMALGLKKLVYALCLVDGDYQHNPFLQLPQVTRVASLDELVALIKAVPYETRLKLFLQRPSPPVRNLVPLYSASSSSSSEYDQSNASKSDDT